MLFRDWGWIAGAVVGGIVVLAIICVIVFMICAKMKAKKCRTVNVASANQPYHTNMTSTQHNHFSKQRNDISKHFLHIFVA